MTLELLPGLSLPDTAVSLSFVRASGPGGQNVNKVSTAVELRVDLERLDWPPLLLARLRARAGRRLNQAGELVLVAQRYRTQEMNRQDAFSRLAELVEAARPDPIKRRKTRPTLGSQQRRLAGKGKRGAVKALRRDRTGGE